MTNGNRINGELISSDAIRGTHHILLEGANLKVNSPDSGLRETGNMPATEAFTLGHGASQYGGQFEEQRH